MYWLTGYDTFGFCFFQCLALKSDGTMVLLTRSADLRQARQTSIIENVVLWTDREGAKPAADLRNLLNDLDLLGGTIGVEYDTHGLTAFNGRRLDEQLQTSADSRCVRRCQPPSPAEEPCRSSQDRTSRRSCRRRARCRPSPHQAGRRRGRHSRCDAGGDLCRRRRLSGQRVHHWLRRRCAFCAATKAGRRKLTKNDQLTLEWAGVYHHYQRGQMRTVIVGQADEAPSGTVRGCPRGDPAVEEVMVPGKTFGDVFDAHARVMEAHGLTRHRLNACGYSLGARFTPSGWTCRCSIPAMRADRTGHVALRHMIIMDFRLGNGDDARPDISDDGRGAEGAVAT